MKSDYKNSASVTLAIFPFENLTEGNRLAIFCKSFCIDLITELSRFRQFQIIAYQSVKDLQVAHSIENTAFSQLNTDYFIQGSFRNDEEQIRINAQLINSHTHHLVWANRFEGKSDDLIEMQENLLREVAASLQQQLNYDLLSHIRKRPKVKLKAYECWLYGIEELKKGSLASDLKAREYFQQAIDIDPEYSLAYSGMSLTYFNEWSCQLWERWEVSQNGACTWAEKAIELDEQNYVAAFVLGRVFLYEGAYESAEYYLHKSLRLNANDPDSLIQIASCFTFLGYGKEAFRLYEKALRLNPANAASYYPVGVFILLELGEIEKAVSLVMQTHTYRWVDAEAFFAAAYYHLGDYDKMNYYWEKFLNTYKKVIHQGKDGTSKEAIEWMMKVNPYRGKTNLAPFWKYISQGEIEMGVSKEPETPQKNLQPNGFLKEGELWKCSFEGASVYLAEVKGFYDLQKLLAHPGQPFHCAELMGMALTAEGEPLIDEKAKRAYQKKILDLQEEISQSEADNDFERSGRLQEEYEQMLEHLSQSLGLQGKIRKSGNPVEKARSAITWRIRNAISKIEKVHLSLGKHLSNSIKTGTLCSYVPEKNIDWIF